MMPRFAANLSMLFNELDFLDRFQAAADAGFSAVEYLFPYAWPADVIKQKMQQAGVRTVLFNLPAGDWEGGERGIASLPDRVGEFREGVGLAIEYALRLGVNQLHCLSGLYYPQRFPEQQQIETLTENLGYAADRLAQHEIKLLVEPINSRIDIPGYIMDTLDQAERILDSLNHSNIYLQFDLYHIYIMHGDVETHLQDWMPRIEHMQLADFPGRHQPGSGEIDYPDLFRIVDKLGYKGWIGAEYIPEKSTRESLQWFLPFKQK